ncbi:ATP-grasp domain-containing protein [Streptomyces sp. NBC_01455]|uniref:ATP-grasp domain-containing protein n=1 Tax=Streptomyces sp. NBC_01455 TaxID=2903874 RepID=UPI002E334862|nr:hypothetical protein [Streptomyces sp. NBC_01455]
MTDQGKPSGAADGRSRPFRRNFIASMERAAARSGAELRWHSERWVAELRRNGRRRHVVGYNFPINDASSAFMASDKVATSVLLSDAGVPNVPHSLLRLRPDDSVADVVARLPLPAVVKPLSSSGGRDVHRAGTPVQLFDTLSALATRHPALTVCPWVPIRHEYRVITLKGRTELVFEKRSSDPSTGPGSTSWDDPAEWRHNLKLGASAVLLDEPELCAVLGGLARRAMCALGLNFGSVDILDVLGDLSVIEVNSGVCLERFSRQDDDCHAAAERVYAAAVAACFAPDEGED